MAAMIVQWALTCAFGCAAFLAVDSPNPMERLLAALLAGFGGTWAVMFLWAWARHGWRAARSLTMDYADKRALHVTRNRPLPPKSWNGQPFNP